MMTRARHVPLLGFALALTLIYGAAVVVASALLHAPRPDVLAAALTLDLAVLVPLLYYGLVVRRAGWPAFSVVPVFLLSLLAASFIVPAEHQSVLDLLKLLVAPAEVFLLGYLGLTAARTARRFQNQPAGADILDRLRGSLRAVLKARLPADVLAFEVALFYYALFAWRNPPMPPLKHQAFSYHQKSGYGSTVAGILVVMLIEMIGLHVLLWLWAPTAAWIVTAVSLYGVLWLLGDWRAICLRPILVGKDALHVRIGLRWTMRVPFSAIVAVQPMAGRPPGRNARGYLAAVVWGRPQYRIELAEPIVAQGLYGMRKTITTLGLAVDDPAAFEAALAPHLGDRKQRAG